MKVDYLIVGAGYTGCVFAERLVSQLGKTVLIVDKRDHIAGNAYDYHDENGVLIHKYGPHIFHTNSKIVWDYLSNFTQWRPYEHHVLAEIEEKKVPVPFNLNSLYKVFSRKFAERLEKLLIENHGFETKIPILKLKQSTNKDLKFLADYIYKNVFYGYTVKQWDLTPEELDPSVTGRVPVFISRDDRYFQDKYQAMPKYGYTEMFQKILNHPGIKLLLNTDYKNIVSDISFNKLIYTGPIDTYFEYLHGNLPYRSLRFELKYKNTSNFQEVAQVNYPNEHKYTRITEFKHLTDQSIQGTTLAFEYPQKYIKGKNIPYYPIPREENRIIYNKYLDEEKKINGNVIFAGRLADYKYYNMDQTVARALNLFQKECS